MLEIDWFILEICVTIRLDFVFSYFVIYKKEKVLYIIFNLTLRQHCNKNDKLQLTLCCSHYLRTQGSMRTVVNGKAH